MSGDALNPPQDRALRDAAAPAAAFAVAGEERASLVPPVEPKHEAARQKNSGPDIAALMAPEPTWRAALRSLRDAVIGGATFYSFMRLMGAAPSAHGAVFFTAFTGLMGFLARTKGTMNPGLPSIVLGAGTLAISAATVAVDVATGAPLSDTGGITAIGGFLGSVMLWFGIRSRRQERRFEAAPLGERVAPVLIPRAELQRRLEESRVASEESTRRFMWKFGVGLGGVMLLVAFPYESVLGFVPPDWFGFVLFFGAWGAFGLTFRTVMRRAREAAARFGLVCPACEKEYASPWGNLRAMKHFEEIGCCPQCGVRVVTEEPR